MGVILVMIIAVVPFTMCYYEQAGSMFNKICTGCCWMIISIVIWALIIVVLWATIGIAEIPITEYLMPISSNFDPSKSEDAAKIIELAEASETTADDVTIDITCSFVVYAVCIVSILGWVFFLVFGGGGLFTLPFDWILQCCFRPRIPSKREFFEYKAKLKRDTEQLLKVIEEKKRDCTSRIASEDESKKSFNRKERKELKKIRQQVQDCVDDFENVRYVENPDDYNVLAPYCKGIFGVIFLLLALVFIAHLLYTIILGEGHFLADAFVAMDGFVPFLGAGFYGVFIVYLAVSTIKGSVKIGTKFLLFEFYPMNEKATLPNAMLFNGMMYMASTLALMQFSNTVFTTYTYNTAVNGMFSGQIQNIRGLKYLFRYLHWVFLVFAVLGFAWSITFQCCIACCDRYHREKKMSLHTHRKTK